MKFLKNYYYALIPMMIPLVFTIIGYFLGYSNSFSQERMVLILVGGLIVVGLGYLIDFYKKYQIQKLNK